MPRTNASNTYQGPYTCQSAASTRVMRLYPPPLVQIILIFFSWCYQRKNQARVIFCSGFVSMCCSKPLVRNPWSSLSPGICHEKDSDSRSFNVTCNEWEWDKKRKLERILRFRGASSVQVPMRQANRWKLDRNSIEPWTCDSRVTTQTHCCCSPAFMPLYSKHRVAQNQFRSDALWCLYFTRI